MELPLSHFETFHTRGENKGYQSTDTAVTTEHAVHRLRLKVEITIATGDIALI